MNTRQVAAIGWLMRSLDQCCLCLGIVFKWATKLRSFVGTYGASPPHNPPTASHCQPWFTRLGEDPGHTSSDTANSSDTSAIRAYLCFRLVVPPCNICKYLG